MGSSSISKSPRKTTITLAIDENLLDVIRGESEQEGISINSKINSVLQRHVLCYRYSEVQGGMIVPDNAVPLFLENIDEDKAKSIYRTINLDLVPSMLLENKTSITLDNWIKYVCNGMLLFGGSFRSFATFEDESGHLNLVFRHNYGIKWSRIISTIYSEFLEKILHYHTETTVLATGVSIKILERNPLKATAS